MTLTHRQWSTLRLKFFPHTSQPDRFRDRKNVGKEVESPDVVQASITKDIGGAAGGFNISLVPRQEYLTDINPNDWVELYLDNGEGSTEPLMVGSVDRVSRRRQVGNNGATRETISISGRDYGKVFLNTSIIIDPLVGAIIDQATFEQAVIIDQFEKNDIPLNGPKAVIEELLKRYHNSRVQCTLPTSLKRWLKTHLEDVRGRIIVTGNPNLSGNLWSTMQQYVNPVLNEFWVDTVNGYPTLFLEERPYSHDKFAHIEGYELRETEVIQEDLGKSDADIRNWIRVYPDAQFLGADIVNVAGVGYSDKFSMARAGLRKLEPTTNAFAEFNRSLVDVNQGIASGLLQEWSGLLAEWNVVNDRMLAGTMTTRLRPDIHVGRRLDYTNSRTGEHLSFYIEGVSHSFTYPGASTTTLTLTRGVERETGDLRFPLLVPLDELTLRFNDLSALTDLSLSDLGDAVREAPVGQVAV